MSAETVSKTIVIVGACISVGLLIFVNPLAAQFCTLTWFILALAILWVFDR